MVILVIIALISIKFQCIADVPGKKDTYVIVIDPRSRVEVIQVQ